MDTSDDGWLLRGSGDPSEVAAYYDAWAGRYDADLVDWAYAAPTVVAAALLDHVPDAQVVLDAGCGTGLVGAALRSAGFTGALHGIDLSEESLRIAREAGAYTVLETADLQLPLAFDDDSFDALSCVGVMTYVPDVERCWREFSRVVRPTGVVVVTQREDLWEQRGCTAVVDRLADDGTWTPIWVSDPEPYLPNNDDYTDRIGVHYVAATIRS
jgi:predicted TPR repeat methyltransferase